MQNLSDLTSTLVHVNGDVPPPLVGPAITATATKVYVCGGRLAQSRKLISDVWELDLKFFRWRKLGDQDLDSENAYAPSPRYFHTCNIWKNYLVCFGGMGLKSSQGLEATEKDMTVLDDLAFFNLMTETWSKVQQCVPQFGNNAKENHLFTPIPETIENDFQPEARYAHISCIVGDTLVILGGQDASHTYIPDFSFYSLADTRWKPSQVFERELGSYRSSIVVVPKSTREYRAKNFLHDGNDSGATDGQGTFSHEYNGSMATKSEHTMYLFSNHNFNDVQRNLLRLSFGEGENPIQSSELDFHIDQTVLPPGLRFPCGSLVGQHLVVSGTFISSESQELATWALDMRSWTWSKIDTGNSLAKGSWNKAIVLPGKNACLVIGNRNRSLIQDYTSRQTNFEHAVLIDLETFGIYEPPQNMKTLAERQVALSILSNGSMTDLQVICIDGRTIDLNSQILKDRWSWFKAICKGSNPDENPSSKFDQSPTPDALQRNPAYVPSQSCLYFPETYPVAIAFFQYLYTQAIWTPEQLQVPVLASLLILAETYQEDLDRLRVLVLHALHQQLTPANAGLIYESATLAGATGLQLRSLYVLTQCSSPAPSKEGLITDRRAEDTQSIDKPVGLIDLPSPVSDMPPSEANSELTTPETPIRDPIAAAAAAAAADSLPLADGDSKRGSQGSIPQSNLFTKSFRDLTSTWSKSPNKGDKTGRRMSLFDSHLQSNRMRSSSSEGSLQVMDRDRVNSKSIDGSARLPSETPASSSSSLAGQRSSWRSRKIGSSSSSTPRSGSQAEDPGLRAGISEDPDEAPGPTAPMSPIVKSRRTSVIALALGSGNNGSANASSMDGLSSSASARDREKKGIAGLLGRLQKGPH